MPAILWRTTTSPAIMAPVDLRLASGRPVELGAPIGTTVAYIRLGIADVLQVPVECVRLVSSAGVEPDDEDQAYVLSTGPTTIVIDRERLEAPFLQACGAAHFEDLVAVEALPLRHVRETHFMSHPDM